MVWNTDLPVNITKNTFEIYVSFCMYLKINMYVVSKNSFLSQIKQPHGRYASLFMVVVNCLHSIALSPSADICLGIPSSIFFQCPRRSGEVCFIWHYIMNMFKPCLRQKKNPHNFIIDNCIWLVMFCMLQRISIVDLS